MVPPTVFNSDRCCKPLFLKDPENFNVVSVVTRDEFRAGFAITSLLGHMFKIQGGFRLSNYFLNSSAYSHVTLRVHETTESGRKVPRVSSLEGCGPGRKQVLFAGPQCKRSRLGSVLWSLTMLTPRTLCSLYPCGNNLPWAAIPEGPLMVWVCLGRSHRGSMCREPACVFLQSVDLSPDPEFLFSPWPLIARHQG